MDEVAGNNQCRFFIQDTENKSWQLFSFSQNKKDGSIYLGSPEFASFEWLTFESDNGKLKSLKLKQDKDGHLSFHGCGQVHVKSKNEEYKLPFYGQHLLKLVENEISLRHLFTIFPKKPEYIPSSEALQRKSDQIIKSSKPLEPFVVIAFAIPRMGYKLNFQMSFDMDDIENFPGNFLGFNNFPLVHHDIFTVFYHTKNMNNWPNKTMLQYLDGVTVPVFIGKPEKNIQVQFRQPTFNLSGNNFEIKL